MNAVPKPKRRARSRPAAQATSSAEAQAAPSTRPASDPREHEYWESELRARLNGAPLPQPPPEVSRLLQLSELFGLSALETDIVAALWTTAHSPAWRAELAARDVFRGHLTVLGLARAFDHAPRIRLPSQSALRLWRLVAEQPFIEGTASLSIDPLVLAWLDGQPELDRALIGRVRLWRPLFELPSWQLDAHAERVRARLDAGECVRIQVSSAEETSARAFAIGLARRLGLLALGVQGDSSSPDEAHERAIRIQRQAFLDQCAPCWRKTDATHAWPDEVPPFPVQIVFGDGPLPADARLRDVDIALAEPAAGERRMLWLSAVPAASTWPEGALDDLALRFEASPEEIIRVAATEPANPSEAALRVREATVNDISDLARPLACPFTWDDLIVPQPVRERLEDIAFEARERAHLWASPEAARLYPQGRGLVALLAGPPGTGKTMSAQVIAADLGLELLRVDISSILSKWVGETAQHMQRVLSSAWSRRAVLFFDEADAFFSRRIEDTRQAQDHFINMDISHLMLALESYTGIVLLATNLKGNVDSAFVRRIRHCVEFTLPDATAREAIWSRAARALFSGEDAVPAEAIRRVARIDATGAQIKNAALSAAFTARRTGAKADAMLLARMLARELSKDGAGLSARELSMLIEAPG